MKINRLVILLFLLQAENNLVGQTLKGCGAIIISEGCIVTCAHVIGNSTGTLIVEVYNGKRYPAKVIREDLSNDLALISINQQTTGYTLLRMSQESKTSLRPVSGELVNIIGYPDDEFDPRGALVEETGEESMHSGHFRVGIGSAYDCSGAPILDDNGMFIGIIAKGSQKNTFLFYRDGIPPPIFGVDASIILPFVLKSGKHIGLSEIRDFYKIRKFEQSERINKIVEIGSLYTVKIYR
jgi:hypothetical protein